MRLASDQSQEAPPTFLAVGRKVDVDDLVGAAEIADRLDIAHRETVINWRRRYPDFPKPVAELRGALIWAWPDVEAWARATGRLGSAP
jgi:hypothetical protein